MFILPSLSCSLATQGAFESSNITHPHKEISFRLQKVILRKWDGGGQVVGMFNLGLCFTSCPPENKINPHEHRNREHTSRKMTHL